MGSGERGNNNSSNGRVTLAVLGVRLDQLKQQMEEHDKRQRHDFEGCRRTCAVDHDTIIRHGTELEALRVDVATAKTTVDGLKAESRWTTALAGIIALAAGALGLTK